LKPLVERYNNFSVLAEELAAVDKTFYLHQQELFSMNRNRFLFFIVSGVSAVCLSLSSAAEAPSAKQSAQQELFFSVQVESAANKAQAKTLEKKLIKKGYPAYIEEVPDDSGKSIYQVRIGKYASRSEAEAAARTFYKKEKKPYLITPPQSDERAAAAEETQKAVRPAAPGAAEENASETPEEAEQTRDPEKMRIGASRDEPATVTRIYTYRGPQGFVGMTNNIEKIPRELQNSVESISIFPVKFIAFNKKKKVLTLEVEKKQQDVTLLGVALSSAPVVEQVSSYCEKNLNGVPLRLKYTPARNEKKAAPPVVTILLRQGTLVNLEIIRLGLARCAADTVPANFKKDCLDAEAAARSSRAGIWAENARQQPMQ
jgi:hypothetical protein